MQSSTQPIITTAEVPLGGNIQRAQEESKDNRPTLSEVPQKNNKKIPTLKISFSKVESPSSTKEPLVNIKSIPSPAPFSNSIREEIASKHDLMLGYSIELRKDKYGRIWTSPVMKVLSYDAFMLNFPQSSKISEVYENYKFMSNLGSNYNFWFPLYINKDHFERSKEHIFNAIYVIYKSIGTTTETEFHPNMTLKVLPPILVKSIMHFLKETVHQSIAGIDAYCQFYYLFTKLVKLFPNLQEAIDTEVDDFCRSERNRHKDTAGDLGEFTIKLALSIHGITKPEILELVYKEYLARQISWACKEDRDLKAQTRCPNFLRRFMKATKVSNQFFLAQIETARLFQDLNAKTELDNNFELLTEARMRAFREKLTWIQRNIVDNWRIFIDELKLGSIINSEKVMIQYILEAYKEADAKNYHIR